MSSEPAHPLPEDWPEHFGDPDLDCHHHFHWDNGDGCYRCITCNESRETPN